MENEITIMPDSVQIACSNLNQFFLPRNYNTPVPETHGIHPNGLLVCISKLAKVCYVGNIV